MMSAEAVTVPTVMVMVCVSLFIVSTVQTPSPWAVTVAATSVRSARVDGGTGIGLSKASNADTVTVTVPSCSTVVAERSSTKRSTVACARTVTFHTPSTPFTA